MRTYYIEIERQGWTLAVVKVEAETYEEAELKALKALHDTDDISEIDEEAVKERVKSGDIDYVIDEDGCEIDLEDEDKGEVKYLIYMVDESGFDYDYDYDNQDEAVMEALRLWEDGEGGYSQISVHELKVGETVNDISEENQIWYADHHM